MEKHSITLGGQVYILPPWNAKQMRYTVHPLLEQSRALMTSAEAIKGTGDTKAALELSSDLMALQQGQQDACLMALKNQYPSITEDQLLVETPTRLAKLFNEILEVTQAGSNEPGEAMPQRATRKKP